MNGMNGNRFLILHLKFSNHKNAYYNESFDIHQLFLIITICWTLLTLNIITTFLHPNVEHYNRSGREIFQVLYSPFQYIITFLTFQQPLWSQAVMLGLLPNSNTLYCIILFYNVLAFLSDDLPVPIKVYKFYII